jgi:L-alanine-DL-glutamate epimerase-like enolase superfamily enzyme
LNFFQQNIQDIPISWLEVDFDDFFEREKFLRIASNKICTGENLLGLDNYLQVIEDSRVEIISIDLIWNGFSEAIRIMEYATKFGKKIAIHNYYSSLASAMALNFYNIIPVNQRELLEFDFDDVPWRDFIIVNTPTYNNGMLNLDSKSGWGVELNQEIIRQHLKSHIILE